MMGLRFAAPALLLGLVACGAAHGADITAPPVAVETLPPRPGSVATWPLIRSPHPCVPGWSQGQDGLCRRHAELIVVCDPDGGACTGLPPNRLPYGLGPYLRPDY